MKIWCRVKNNKTCLHMCVCWATLGNATIWSLPLGYKLISYRGSRSRSLPRWRLNVMPQLCFKYSESVRKSCEFYPKHHACGALLMFNRRSRRGWWLCPFPIFSHFPLPLNIYDSLRRPEKFLPTRFWCRSGIDVVITELHHALAAFLALADRPMSKYEDNIISGIHHIVLA